MDADFWDTRYRESSRVWSGKPNTHLVAETADLRPGRVLDAGCGEGADAVWLARHGWDVDAVDFSPEALRRASRNARQAGLDSRVTWMQRDLTGWSPTKEYDLVSAQFLHLEPAEREVALQSLSSALRVGGTFLVVGHHRDDAAGPSGKKRRARVLFDSQDIAHALDQPDWIVEISGVRQRTAEDGIVHTDTVFRAVRAA